MMDKQSHTSHTQNKNSLGGILLCKRWLTQGTDTFFFGRNNLVPKIIQSNQKINQKLQNEKEIKLIELLPNLSYTPNETIAN